MRAEDDQEAASDDHAAVGKRDDESATGEEKEAYIADIFVANGLHSPSTILISRAAAVNPITVPRYADLPDDFVFDVGHIASPEFVDYVGALSFR